MIKNKKILITGAAGFIGSHLTETLLNQDNYLLLIDNFNDYYLGKEERLNQVLEKFKSKIDFELFRENLVNASLYDKLDNEIDYIFHLAAQAGVRYSIENASEVAYNNIVSTVNIFEFSKKIDNLQKVVFASSSSVYGNPIYTPVDEDHPKNPISPYALSKLSGELYAKYYFKECDIPITSLRFYTVYGPYGRPDMAIRKFFNLIFGQKKLKIYGDGTQRRDFTYVSDIVDGLILAAETKAAVGEEFNLGRSDPITVNKLVDLMYKIAKKSKNVKYVEKQKGDVEVTHSDISKAKKMLNFHPKISIKQGLVNQYEWQVAYK